jgi:hypothetical protein
MPRRWAVTPRGRALYIIYLEVSVTLDMGRPYTSYTFERAEDARYRLRWIWAVMWLAAVLMLSPVQWTAGSASALNLIVFTACIVIVQPFCLVRIPPTTRPWYEFVLRAGLVALLVGVIVTLSFQIGPTGSGVLAVFPVIYTSIMLILHRRVGGPATAAVLANAVPALAGFGVALLTLHLAAVPLGSGAALIIALGVSVVWNAVVYAIRRRQTLA